MNRSKLVSRIIGGAAVATLAFGAVACEAGGNGELDPGQEQAPEGELEGEGGLEGEGEGEGDF